MSGNRGDDFERNSAFSLYNLYGNALAQESLPRELWNLHFGNPILVIITINLVCKDHATE